MVKKLTKLRIDEISSVDRGAGEGCKIVLMKRDDDSQDDDDSQSTVADKLDGMVDAMLLAAPTLDRQKAAHYLIHTAHGRRLYEHLSKQMEASMPQDFIQKIMDDNAAISKRLAELEAGGELVALTYQATNAGLPESEGATIQKALNGDKEAVKKLLGYVKVANAAARASGVFQEFGSGTGVVTDAYDELAVLAKNLQKSDPRLSFSVAFSKVYEDPANYEIVKRERSENRPSAVLQ